MGALNVAIVGAGIGGLTAAIALRSHGVNVAVYEKAHELRELGAGVTIGANGARVYDSLGLRDSLDAIAGKISTMTWKTWRNESLPGYRPRYPLEQTYPVHRAEFQNMLLAALPPGVVHLGYACVAAVEDIGGAFLRCGTIGDARRAHLIHQGPERRAYRVVRRFCACRLACRGGAVDRFCDRVDASERSGEWPARSNREPSGWRNAGHRRPPTRQPGRRSRARVLRRRLDPGHHQCAGSVFRADRDVMERGVPTQGEARDPQEIGRHLAVAYLVEGSVRLTGDRVRVTAQLVDTRDGRVLWTVRLDEALADVFAMQDSITSQIVGALAARGTQIEQRRVLKKPTENLEAYDLVLRARPALQSPTRANNVEARMLLKRAIELDPNCVRGARRHLSYGRIDGLGGITVRLPGSRRRTGKQGAKSR
jgi:hypothetical protein